MLQVRLADPFYEQLKDRREGAFVFRTMLLELPTGEVILGLDVFETVLCETGEFAGEPEDEPDSCAELLSGSDLTKYLS